MAEFKVHGLDELYRKFERIPDDLLRREILKDSVAAMSGIVKNEMVARAPVRRFTAKGKEPPGFLKKNITDVRQRVRRDIEARKVGVRKRAYYWRFLEFGTARMAARPFIRPAVEAKAVQAVGAFKDRFAAGLLQVAVK